MLNPLVCLWTDPSWTNTWIHRRRYPGLGQGRYAQVCDEHPLFAPPSPLRHDLQGGAKNRNLLLPKEVGFCTRGLITFATHFGSTLSRYKWYTATSCEA